MASFVRLNATDNIVVLLERARKGAIVDGVVLSMDVPRGHKVAVSDIAAGKPIFKYGQIIGIAKENIHAGTWVHDNIEVSEFERSASSRMPVANALSIVPRTFDGYHREGGKVGTRNYLGILTSVNCSAHAAHLVANEIERSGILEHFPNVDGVIALSHGTGCGMDNQGEGFDILQRTLLGYASNPNFGGVLMIGLGCEVFQLQPFIKKYGLMNSDNFRSFIIQEQGGTRQTVAAAMKAVKELLPIVNSVQRRPSPLSALILGLQCGGSDGLSGITANPSLGYAVDLLVAHGGTAILSETPEIFGAEHLLASRAADEDVKARLLGRVDWWRSYTERHNMHMDNNPSPGNKAGGISTILEKSLGSVAKGGKSPLQNVYLYAEPVWTSGLVFMDTPGYDPVSATGQVAGGANIICFTTGRGSAFGCKPAPSLKLASNTELFERMNDDMDINCGDVLEGVSIREKGEEILEAIINAASGTRTKSEQLGYGLEEFVPWHIGATM